MYHINAWRIPIFQATYVSVNIYHQNIVNGAGEIKTVCSTNTIKIPQKTVVLIYPIPCLYVKGL